MRLLQLLKSKIHGATVTEANVDYVGSIGIDEDLIEAVGLLPGELVHVWDVDNAQRFETYVIVAPRGSGIVSVNGAAAKRVAEGHKVIIAAFCLSDEPVTPTVITVDSDNRLAQVLVRETTE